MRRRSASCRMRARGLCCSRSRIARVISKRACRRWSPISARSPRSPRPGGPVAVSTSTFTADQPALDKIVGGFAISDTAADVVQNLGALSGDPNIASITASNGPVAVSTATFLADQSTLDKIVGGFDISDTAADISANLDQLDDSNIDVITISDNGQVQRVGRAIDERRDGDRQARECELIAGAARDQRHGRGC